MKKILILGAGNAQIDLIEYCNENNYEVYGCSYTNTDKGIPLLDHFEQINIVDADKIEEYAKKNSIDIIYSVGSDIAMPTVSKVAERLNLPHFVSYETAMTCNTKDHMREELGNDFEGNVPYAVITQPEELEKIDFFPAIMKPVDSQGQRGVCEVNSVEDLKSNYERSISFSRKKRLIIEKYLEGTEISVNAFFEKGKLIFAIVSDRISFDEFPGGIIKEHMLPTSFSKEVSDRAVDLACRVAEKLEISDGPAYFQMKVVNEQPYLIEVTPRLDGCHMWRFIKYYCGVDLLKMTMDLLEGKQGINVSPTYKKGLHTLEFICQPPETTMKEIEFPGVAFRRDYYQKSDKIRKLNGYMEKCGYVIYQVK